MNRIDLIQEIFKKTKFQNYLEIGCSKGLSFLPIKAKHKTAVDPFFQIKIKHKIKWLIKVPENINNTFFEEESDTFFRNRKKYLENLGKLDVVLVDGLHTFRAALNDVLNSLKYLNNDGIIIMHDCYPSHKAAAAPTKLFPTLEEQKGIEGWTEEWCGDVWKAIVYLRKNFSDSLDVSVINIDYGLGIVKPKCKIDTKDLIINEASFMEIDKLTYEDLVQDPKAMLSLKDPEYTTTIIKEMTQR